MNAAADPAQTGPDDRSGQPGMHVGAAELTLVRGDITTIPADAIVNAANEALRGGGGVDGAIHRAGGPSILAELRERYPHGTPTGTAAATGAGHLPATWVIHAVGPSYRDGRAGEAEQLRSAYESALTLAAELGAKRVTLPAISCGVYGYPLDEAARIALATVRDHLARETMIERATFVLYSDETFRVFQRALRDIERPPAG